MRMSLKASSYSVRDGPAGSMLPCQSNHHGASSRCLKICKVYALRVKFLQSKSSHLSCPCPLQKKQQSFPMLGEGLQCIDELLPSIPQPRSSSAQRFPHQNSPSDGIQFYSATCNSSPVMKCHGLEIFYQENTTI